MKLSKKGFRRTNLFTLFAVYFLILVGGIVRSVGAGMGCPDWPKCFGGIYPPNNVSQLPENYKEIFLQERVTKNQRLARTLTNFGFSDLANRIGNDPNILVEEDFSPVKAWVEYINRIIGVLIGFSIIGTMTTSFSYWKENKKIVIFSILSFVLVVFQGWIGSLVVSTNLLPGFVSFHMALALVLVAFLIYTYSSTLDRNLEVDKLTYRLSIALFVLLIPQIFLGTQVRESVDLLLTQGIERIEWISNLDWKFYIHRSYSLLFAGIVAYLYLRLRKKGLGSTHIGRVTLGVVILVIIEILGGAVMSYFEIPPFIQPLHLLAGSLLFGMVFYLILLTKNQPAHSL